MQCKWLVVRDNKNYASCFVQLLLGKTAKWVMYPNVAWGKTANEYISIWQDKCWSNTCESHNAFTSWIGLSVISNAEIFIHGWSWETTMLWESRLVQSKSEQSSCIGKWWNSNFIVTVYMHSSCVNQRVFTSFILHGMQTHATILCSI